MPNEYHKEDEQEFEDISGSLYSRNHLQRLKIEGGWIYLHRSRETLENHDWPNDTEYRELTESMVFVPFMRKNEDRRSE